MQICEKCSLIYSLYINVFTKTKNETQNSWNSAQLDIIYNMETILWDFLMFYHFFFSPQVKRSAVIINKQGVYELPHELPNNLRLKNDCRSSRENIYNLKMKIKNCSNQICEKCLIKKWREDRQQAKGVPERDKFIRNPRDSENLWAYVQVSHLLGFPSFHYRIDSLEIMCYNFSPAT